MQFHKIAQAFIQANRIAKKVIKNGGDNKFMGNGGSISGEVRKDFKMTEFGVRYVPIVPHDVRCQHGCCVRTYVPLALAYGKTAHTFQGQTVGPVPEGRPV